MIENEKIEEMMMELEEKCENTLNALERDYGAIRTGRANPRILDRLEVDAKTNGLNGELKEFLTLFFLSASFSFPSPLVKATAK